MSQGYKGRRWLVAGQLSLFMAYATTYAITFHAALHNMDDNHMHSIDLVDQCPPRGLIAFAGPPLTEMQCPRHGPCYGGGEVEFCVFTATTKDDLGISAILPMVTARQRAPAVMQVLSDADSTRHNDSLQTQPTYTVVPIPGKGLGMISTGELG